METRSSDTAQPMPAAVVETSRRQVLLRDSLTFLVLLVCTLVLGGITTFLFRSFQAHRDDLAILWAQRGRDALQHGRSAEAVAAFRSSLSYRPDDGETTLALAEALAAGGHVNEAENYFLGLWQGRPGDGMINLQLARLERSRGDAPVAINDYRASIFGTWNGDAAIRRRDLRIELAHYLVSRGESQAAVAELLIAAGNNPDGASQLAIGQALESAHDPEDALTAYRHAQESEPDREVAKAREGELCYSMGGYICAASQLLAVLHAKRWTGEQRTRMTTMQQDAERLRELSFSPDVTPTTRAEHLLKAAQITQARLRTCMHAAVEGQGDAKANQLLQTRWKTLDSARNRNAMRHDETVQQQYGNLMEDTESALAQTCGPPTGDDALLLYAQRHPMTHFGEQPE